MRPILVIGRRGQLGSALARIGGGKIRLVGRPQVDLTRADTLAAALAATRPRAVINAAAYTDVDRAENEPETAHAVNAEGPHTLARLCEADELPLVHLSSDYVFAGDARVPYPPDAAAAPLGAYGRSKAEGETAVREGCTRHLIVRTAWLYSADGRNFVRTMLGFAGKRDIVRVVDDQTGSPTFADDLAAGLLAMLDAASAGRAPPAWGTYHLAGAGTATWYELAARVFAHVAAAGRPVPEVVAITTPEYPTPAPRPRWSVLDTSQAREVFGVALPHWHDGLARCMARLLGGVRDQARADAT